MKRITCLLAIAACAVSAFTLSACGLLALPGDDNFPYDLAQTRGEDGSEASWLASLDTPSSEARRAYDEAVKDGSFEGTFYEFLRSVGDLRGSGAGVQRALRSVVSIECSFTRDGRLDSGTYYIAGSGVVYSLDAAAGDALIVTNYHIVYNAGSLGNEAIAHISDDIEVFLYGGETASRAIKATYVGGSMNYDIAVLAVTGSDAFRAAEGGSVSAAPAVAADSDSVTVGETVYAVGNAEGDGIAATRGVVSVDAEYITVEASDEKSQISLLEIRTDAAVNHGNSGGGLFNESGELVGIVNARSEEEGVTAFGYAIPANLALSVAQNIVDSHAADPAVHSAVRATLGVTVATDDSRGVFDETTGKYYIEEKVVVRSVQRDSAAEKAGVWVGDTIVRVKLSSTRGGVPYERVVDVTRRYKFTDLMFEVRQGDTLTLTVSRNGAAKEIEVSFEDGSAFSAVV